MKVSIFCLLGVMATTGCTLTTSSSKNKTVVAVDPALAQPTTERNTVDYYTQKLAHQLYNSVITLKPSAGIAIGTFTQVDSLMLNSDKNHPLRLLGLQLEEGMMSATIRQGLKVIEYKTRKNLTLKSDQDLMLSRDIGQLSASNEIRYFLTGTLTEQENGVVVNARLIDTDNNQVVAAATDYVPIDVFWQENKVKMKQNMIYRTGY
ncbi:MAG: TolB-like protein [Phenylobacterium sp.]|jgi:TolB-like protein